MFGIRNSHLNKLEQIREEEIHHQVILMVGLDFTHLETWNQVMSSMFKLMEDI